MNHQNENREAGSALTYEQVLELLPGYVMGALESDEMLAVDAYIERHPELRGRVEHMTELTTALAYAAPPVTAPPNVKANVLQRAHGSLHATHDDTAAAATEGDSVRAEATEDVAPTHRKPSTLPARSPLLDAAAYPHGAPRPATVPEPPPSQPWWSWITRPLTWQLASAALALILFVVGATAVQLRNMVLDLQEQLAVVQDTNESLAATNAALGAENDALATELTATRDLLTNQDIRLTMLEDRLALLSTPDRIVSLVATEDAPNPDVAGSFYVHDNTGLLLLEGLTPLDAQQSYQLWLIPAEGDPVSAGLVFAATEEQPGGVTLWTDNIPLTTEQFDTVGISVEPAGGSELPTGPIVLIGAQPQL